MEEAHEVIGSLDLAPITSTTDGTRAVATLLLIVWDQGGNNDTFEGGEEGRKHHVAIIGRILGPATSETTARMSEM